MNPMTMLAIGMPGMWEWVIILVIALLLFGRRLPEVMRGLGGGVREFRKGLDGAAEEAKGEAVSHRSEDKPASSASESATAESEVKS